MSRRAARHPFHRPARAALTVAFLGGAVIFAAPAEAQPRPSAEQVATCPPHGRALSFSDALDKREAFGAEVGGLSALARDVRRRAYAAIEDHSEDQPTRLWFLRGVPGSGDPRVTGTLLLRQADGTAYTGSNFDAEGLAVLPGGDYLVSSEDEPSIHEFARSGVERGQLPVPPRFRVAPAGEATPNATLEGLTVARDGRRVYAAMEGTLSGDVAASGDASYRRFLVYARAGKGYRLDKQVGYRVDPGMRVAEVQRYGRDSLLVLEAAFVPGTGNTIRLYAVTDVDDAGDVSAVPNLGDDPARVVHKQLVADVTRCPDLGATAKEPQANPLMDNYEAMTVRPLRRAHSDGGHGHGRRAEVVLLSDDNFSDQQTTRVLRLAVRLP